MSKECITVLQDLKDLKENRIRCPKNKFIQEIDKKNKRATIKCCSPQKYEYSLNSIYGNNRTQMLMIFVIIMLILLMFLGKNIVAILLVFAFLKLANVDIIGIFNRLMGNLRSP